MEIKITRENDCISIKLKGFLDTNASPELLEKTEALLEETPSSAPEIEFDFAELNFLSSAGLLVLLRIIKRLKKGSRAVTLVNVNDSVKQVLEMTGFMNILSVK